MSCKIINSYIAFKASNKILPSVKWSWATARLRYSSWNRMRLPWIAWSRVTLLLHAGPELRIATSAKVVIVVVLKRAFECFILHYSALVVWLGFYTRNYGQINLLRQKKSGKSISVFCTREWQIGTVSSFIFIHIRINFDGARERHGLYHQKSYEWIALVSTKL